MKKLFFAFVFIIFIIVIFSLPKKQSSQDHKTIIINSHQLRVEIADTDEKRSQGLSGRDKLEEDEGMLFIYQTPGYYKFWMKDMQFPLDFIWIEGDKIVDITENVLIPDKNNQFLPVYTSLYKADKILEVNAGLIKSKGVKIGDKIIYER